MDEETPHGAPTYNPFYPCTHTLSSLTHTHKRSVGIRENKVGEHHPRSYVGVGGGVVVLN